MKTRYKLLFSVLLVWAQVFAPSLIGRVGGGSALMAQDAFYIYRNDGQFDGFFFDEIKRMGYSKFDLDSVEYDVYVVQEIETADSLYRIPLAAIDSIGFQQPEIRFSPRFKNLDVMGLTQYFSVERDKFGIVNVYLTYPSSYYWSIEGAYIPQPGDVIASTTADFLGKEGFCLKVSGATKTQMDNGNVRFRIKYTDVDSFGDVFDQFITTERIYTDEQGNVRRRIAGCNEDGTVRRGLAREKGNADISLISMTANIQREYEPKEGVKIDLGAEVGLELGLRVTYNCSWRRIYVKFEAPADFKLTPKVGVKASKSFEWPVDGLPKFLKAIKFPVQCPIFQTLPLPELVLRGGGDIAATINFPSVGFGVQQNFVIDTDAAIPTQYWWSKSTTGSEAGTDAVDLGSAEMSLSGNVQLALKLSANIETCDWFSSLLFCRIGLDIFVGPKVEGNIKVSTDMMDKYQSQNNSSGLYAFFRDAYFKVIPMSIDIEANGCLGYLFKDAEDRQFLSKNVSFFPATFYAIPRMTEFTAEPIHGYPYGKIVLKAKTENRPFLPTDVGATFSIDGCYPFSGERLPESFYKTIYFGSHYIGDNEKENTYTINDIVPGRYSLRSKVKFLGAECETGGYQKLYVWPTKFNHAKVVLQGLQHKDNHDWGTNEDGTSVDYHPITDEVDSYKCDLDVQSEGDEYFTLTGTITDTYETGTLTLHAKIEDGMMYILDGNWIWDREVTEEDSHSSSYYYRYKHDHQEFSFSNKKIPVEDGLTFRAKDSVDVVGSSYVNGRGKLVYYNDDGSVKKESWYNIENKSFFKEGEQIIITVELGF